MDRGERDGAAGVVEDGRGLLDQVLKPSIPDPLALRRVLRLELPPQIAEEGRIDLMIEPLEPAVCLAIEVRALFGRQPLSLFAVA